GNNVTVQELSEWTVTTAPNNNWAFYWKDTYTESGKEIKPFLPGYGLHLHAPKVEYNINFKNPSSAGVDCLGFAVCSASYKDNPYKNWTDLPSSVDQFKDCDTELRIDNSGYRIHFPHNEENRACVQILNRVDIGFFNNQNQGVDFFKANFGASNSPTPEYLEEVRQKFLKVTPGDIIRYDSSHIGIVAYVDGWGINNATNIYNMLECIKVIESIYGDKVLNVIKRRATNGVYDELDGPGSWFLDWNKNLRNFVIERLLY
ncbi:MAG: hypothetical protein IIT58_05365, partial [Treponema sp.]|nr:hypothetical protein [Treponema sp.]